MFRAVIRFLRIIVTRAVSLSDTIPATARRLHVRVMVLRMLAFLWRLSDSVQSAATFFLILRLKVHIPFSESIGSIFLCHVEWDRKKSKAKIAGGFFLRISSHNRKDCDGRLSTTPLSLGSTRNSAEQSRYAPDAHRTTAAEAIVRLFKKEPLQLFLQHRTIVVHSFSYRPVALCQRLGCDDGHQ